MPLKLSHLVADRRACAVDFGGGDVLAVEFFPRRITGAMLVRLNAARTAAVAAQQAAGGDATDVADLDAAGTVAAVTGVTDDLLAVLAAWDLLGDDGAVLPIDRATLDDIGIAVQWAIFGAVLTAGSGGDAGEAAAPGGPSAATSGAGSSPRGSSARRRTGTR